MFLVRSVCLSVCLSVGLLANLWTDFVGVRHGSRTKWYNFGGDPDHASDPGVHGLKSGSSGLPCSAEVCALWAYLVTNYVQVNMTYKYTSWYQPEQPCLSLTTTKNSNRKSRSDWSWVYFTKKFVQVQRSQSSDSKEFLTKGWKKIILFHDSLVRDY